MFNEFFPDELVYVLFGYFWCMVADVVFSIATYFLEKAKYFRLLYKKEKKGS